MASALNGCGITVRYRLDGPGHASSLPCTSCQTLHSNHQNTYTSPRTPIDMQRIFVSCGRYTTQVYTLLQIHDRACFVLATRQNVHRKTCTKVESWYKARSACSLLQGSIRQDSSRERADEASVFKSSEKRIPIRRHKRWRERRSAVRQALHLSRLIVANGIEIRVSSASVVFCQCGHCH
jgi:hypothetical protein